MSRTPAKRSYQIAVCLGTAASTAVIAAAINFGTAPLARADVTDGDAVTALVGALDPNPLSAADAVVGMADPAETVSEANAFSYLIDAFFPSQFSATGAPTGLLGLGGYFLDTYLFGPNGLLPFVDNFLEPFVLELTGTTTTEAATAAAVGAVDPVTDMFGALDPGALVSTIEPGAVLGGVDPGGAFSVLDSVVDALVGTGTLF
jgi:hypothetical protein